MEPTETTHEALERECKEEIGCEVTINYLSGVYYHSAYDSQAFIFRCEISPESEIKLSSEHTEFKFQSIASMSAVQQRRIKECLEFKGKVLSAKF